MKRWLILAVKFIIGMLYYASSKKFRDTVRAKIRGTNEPVEAGEQVIAVLKNTKTGKEQVI